MYFIYYILGLFLINKNKFNFYFLKMYDWFHLELNFKKYKNIVHNNIIYMKTKNKQWKMYLFKLHNIKNWTESKFPSFI